MLNLTNIFYTEINTLKFSKFKGGNLWDLNCQPEKVYYISLKKYLVSDLDEGELFLSFYADSDNPIAAFVIFYDESGNKIGSMSTQNYRSSLITIPNEAFYFQPAIRIKNNFSLNLYSIFIASKEETDDFILKNFSITDENFSISSSEKEKILIMETMFCDVEQDISILKRYFSYLKMQSYLFEMHKKDIPSSFIWVVHVSEDKQYYIDELKKISLKLPFLIVNIYKHGLPSNRAEVKIDHLKKPNLLGVNYDNVFASFFNKLSVDLKNKIIIRFGLDDDDFISKFHFSKIFLAIEKNYNDLNELKEIYIGFLDTNIVYHFMNGECRVDSIIMQKCMTGNRFSIGLERIPMSPFALPEDFTKANLNGSDKHFIYNSDFPTFFYNRHGINLSKNNKSSHYKKMIKESHFKSKKDFFNFFFVN